MQAPVEGSTVETKALGFSHWRVPGWVTPGIGVVVVQGHAGDDAGELGSAAVDDAVAVRGVRRAQDGKRQAAAPEERSGNLPAFEELLRGRVDVAGGEIVADVVIAGTAVAGEVAGDGRKDSAVGERKKSAV